MALSEETLDRLENWKFHSAWHAVTGDPASSEATEDERELILALDETFGNVGWFDGSLSVIVAAAVSTLIPGERGEAPVIEVLGVSRGSMADVGNPVTLAQAMDELKAALPPEMIEKLLQQGGETE